MIRVIQFLTIIKLLKTKISVNPIYSKQRKKALLLAISPKWSAKACFCGTENWQVYSQLILDIDTEMA
jgi:hypothetical protein